MKHRHLLLKSIAVFALITVLSASQGTVSFAENSIEVSGSGSVISDGVYPAGGVYEIVQETAESDDDEPAADPVVYTTAQDAGRYVRKCMKNRQTPIELTVSEGIKWESIFKEATKHDPDDPDGGDYIYRHCEGYHTEITAGDSVTAYSAAIDYLSTREQEAEVDILLAEALADPDIQSASSDYSKVKAVYDHIAKSVEYDYDNLNDDTYKQKYTAYSALHDKKTVCQGYSSLLYRMLLSVGVDCRIISGYADANNDGYINVDTERHAWNIVNINGRWYDVDVTWDSDYCNKNGYLSHCWFLRSEDDFGNRHIRDDEFNNSTFTDAYPVSTASWQMTDGHKYECIYRNASYHALQCIHCADIKSVAEHSFDEGTITKQPTSAESGIRRYVCSECKGTYDEGILMQFTEIPDLPFSSIKSLNSDLSSGLSTGGTMSHLYRYYGRTDEVIRIDLDRQFAAFGDADPYLYVLDSSHNVLAKDDNSGGGVNASVTIKLPRNGFYLIEACYKSEDPDQSGAYKLSVSIDAPKTDPAKAAAEAKAKKVKTVTVNTSTVSAAAIDKAVRKKGGSYKYVTKIVLGSNVKKISKNAFKKYKNVSTVVVKTKKLKKAAVKGSLAGSKVTKIQVKIGTKKVNNKYIKAYKKIFTKANTGRKVKVTL